ncbi:MAG: DUF1641 domain-containing protein [Bacteroidetes bacterium]|jgi:uncharacterized protein YjgD (DUF1641 family)|nr:DUF1641 domain-containing protein [Bacteroidota bacterium]MBT6684775.1 DUF1641 domain-containing protein [Bacteroidota bacterium]MBT7141809.1 DUF1641 domain-containing protein [Bacteroidota bacterium]MBT7490758.1 DUF1641 domain-containing protein [Bacteroidota bacterium]
MDDVKTQIDTLNAKVDLILDYVNQQRLKTAAVDDLLSDLAIVGKDVYDSTVEELDNAAVEIDPEDLRILGIKLIRNIKNFISLINSFESLSDFVKDASPIFNELIIDFTNKLNEFDKNGYFDFFKEVITVFNNVINHFSTEDMHQLANNAVTILETVKSFTQPDMLKSVNNAMHIFKNMEIENVPEYSLWKLMKEINKPEMRRALGFMVVFIKNVSNSQNQLNEK